MQSSHNLLFENFGVFSTVMPYFDTAHKSFYFLSQFNIQSRAMLDKYYEGFLNVMIGNLATLELEENENIIKLPCDLFRYKIDLSCESRVEIFIKLIKTINNENGCYFNEHLMNTRFCVDRICINEKFVKQLYPYLDLLKKTEVTDCTVNHENLLLIEKSALINSISISIDLYKDTYFPHYIYTGSDKRELDPIFESFRKIDNLNLNRVEVESAIKCLTEAKELKLQINSLQLYPKTAEELEDLTNPVLFVKGVNFVEFILDPSFAFTDIFYNNINTIKPGRLLFSIAEKPTEEFDYVSIFANIKYKSNIKLMKGSLCSKYELRFESVPILVKKNHQDPIFIKCRNFVCFLKIEEFGDSFLLTNKSKSIKNKDITFLHILNWNRLECTNHVYVKDIEEINQLQDIFIEHLSESKFEQEFVLPISNIKYVDIDMDQAQQTVIHRNGSVLIKELLKAPSFMCTLRFSYFLCNIDKCLFLYPKKCFYSFESYGSFKNKIEKYINAKYEEVMIKLSCIRVSKMRFFHLLTPVEIKLINRIISSSVSKFYLKSVIMYIYYIDDVIKVLGRLSDCLNIESVFIKYKYTSSKKIALPENELEKAKILFYKKVDVHCEVSIHNDPLMN